MDDAGRPWVLEVNANPCIAPHSGFTVAAEKVGLDYAAMIDRILEDTLSPAAETTRSRWASRWREEHCGFRIADCGFPIVLVLEISVP